MCECLLKSLEAIKANICGIKSFSATVTICPDKPFKTYNNNSYCLFHPGNQCYQENANTHLNTCKYNVIK